MFAGGLEFDFLRNRDLPDRHLGSFPVQLEDLDPEGVGTPLRFVPTRATATPLF
jgi:hypothetical protein